MIRLSPRAVLYHADMRDALKLLPDNSIDSVVCDPPYHLTSIVKRFGGPNAAPAQYGTDGAFARASRGFMSKSWDGGDIAFQPATWAEVLRVLKPGGYCAAFGAPRNFGRLQVAMFEAGFEERDTILNDLDPTSPIAMFLDSLNDAQRDAFMKCMDQSDLNSLLAWKFGVGFPKSQDVAKFIDRELGAEREKVKPRSVIGHQRNIGNVRPYMLDPNHMTDSDEAVTPEAQAYQGFGTALKPAFEPIVLARKPLSEGTIAANVLRWGTGALNIDGCRVEAADSQLAEKYASVQNAGPRTNSVYGVDNRDRKGAAPHDAGRWPANVVHSGEPEVIAAFPTTSSGGRVKAAGTVEKSNWRAAEGRTDPKITGSDYVRAGDGGSAARFFYSAKASKADRNGSKHPTVKPIALMQWLARLTTPPGGTVLDPFAGSGTTGAACEREGFACVLVEREAEYVADIRNRFGGPKGAVEHPWSRVVRWNAAVLSYRAAHV